VRWLKRIGWFVVLVAVSAIIRTVVYHYMSSVGYSW